MNMHCRSIVRAAARACNQPGPKVPTGTSGVVQQRCSGVVSDKSRVRCISSATATTARSSPTAKGVVSSRGKLSAIPRVGLLGMPGLVLLLPTRFAG